MEINFEFSGKSHTEEAKMKIKGKLPYLIYRNYMVNAESYYSEVACKYIDKLNL